jgi:glycosyltransferase involved in cell wall biosynthesis
MRVAIDARYLDGTGSGIGAYTYNLVNHLLEVDEALELLLVFSNRAGARTIDHPRVTKTFFPASPNSLRTRLLLGPVLSRHAFDLLHVPYAVLPWRFSRPLVVTIHDLMWIVDPTFISHSPLTRVVAGTFYQTSIRHALARADRILTVSEGTRRDIVAERPACAPRTVVTHQGIDPRHIFPLPRAAAFAAIGDIVPPETPFVLTVGNNSPHKNHLRAIRAFLAAFGDRPEYRMVVVRRFLRQDRELNALLAEPRVKRQVITLPHVTSAIVNALYNAARICLHPSLYEGFGLPPLEAMAVGTPVVTSNVSCMPEVAGDAALLVDPTNVDDLARALRRLDADEPLRAQLIARGRARHEHYDWRVVARTVLDVYRDLYAESHGGRAPRPAP